MSYAALNAGFLALALLVFAAAAVARRLDRTSVLGILAGVGALFVLTAVFDNIMIGVGLFDYDAAALAGPRIGLAPLEDFAYPLGAGILLPSAWLLLGGGLRGRGRQDRGRQGRCRQGRRLRGRGRRVGA